MKLSKKFYLVHTWRERRGGDDVGSNWMRFGLQSCALAPHNLWHPLYIACLCSRCCLLSGGKEDKEAIKEKTIWPPPAALFWWCFGSAHMAPPLFLHCAANLIWLLNSGLRTMKDPLYRPSIWWDTSTPVASSLLFSSCHLSSLYWETDMKKGECKSHDLSSSWFTLAWRQWKRYVTFTRLSNRPTKWLREPGKVKS